MSFFEHTFIGVNAKISKNKNTHTTTEKAREKKDSKSTESSRKEVTKIKGINEAENAKIIEQINIIKILVP